MQKGKKSKIVFTLIRASLEFVQIIKLAWIEFDHLIPNEGFCLLSCIMFMLLSIIHAKLFRKCLFALERQQRRQCTLFPFHVSISQQNRPPLQRPLKVKIRQGPRRHYETGGSKSRIFSNFLGSPNFIYMIQKNLLCPPKSGGSVDPLDPLPTRALVKIQINNTFQNPRLKFWKCQKSLLILRFFLFIWLLIDFGYTSAVYLWKL